MTIFITENYYLKLKVYRYIKRQMMYHYFHDTSSVFLSYMIDLSYLSESISFSNSSTAAFS